VAISLRLTSHLCSVRRLKAAARFRAKKVKNRVKKGKNSSKSEFSAFFDEKSLKLIRQQNQTFTSIYALKGA
jgi:hypothetical protein